MSNIITRGFGTGSGGSGTVYIPKVYNRFKCRITKKVELRPRIKINKTKPIEGRVFTNIKTRVKNKVELKVKLVVTKAPTPVLAVLRGKVSKKKTLKCMLHIERR